MNNILVPIDFSPTSNNAARYAANLAKQFSDTHIFLYHSYQFRDVESFATSYEEDAAQQMVLLLDSLLAIHPDLNYTTIIDRKFLIAGINSLIDQHQIALVIMGSRGKSAIAQKLIGSNTITIANNISIPLLIVPEHAQFSSLSSMLVALPFDADADHKVPIQEIQKLTAIFPINLNFVTVEAKKDNASLFQIFTEQQTVMANFKGQTINYAVLDGKDIAKSMLDYAQLHQISWLSTFVEEKGFWQRLIKGSVTDNLATLSDRPILVFRLK